jgi:hypothetical protein
MASSPSPPPAPDPYATASAQTGENMAAVVANDVISKVPQTDQYGNTTTYNQTGNFNYKDPTNGNTYALPQYSQQTSMSPQNQAIYNSVQNAEGGMANDANALLKQEQGNLSNPVDLSKYQVGAYKAPAAYQAPSAFNASSVTPYEQTSWETPFNQEQALQTQQFNQQLADQGIAPGSQAYTNAQLGFTQNQTNAWDTANAANYGTAANTALGAYNENSQNALNAWQANATQGLNAYNANLSGNQFNQQNAIQGAELPLQQLDQLLGGATNAGGSSGGGTSQFSTPNFEQVSTPTVPTTNITSDIYASAANQMAGYQSQMAAQNSLYGGLFGMGGSILGKGGLLGAGGLL